MDMAWCALSESVSSASAGVEALSWRDCAGLVVCHKCDVRACVNPEHLFLGTMMDNVRDMMEKGRGQHGEKNRSAKLTTEQVRRIKTMLAEGFMRVSDIAREYGVTHSTIGCIARGTSWRHVKLATPSFKARCEQPKEEPLAFYHGP